MLLLLGLISAYLQPAAAYLRKAGSELVSPGEGLVERTLASLAHLEEGQRELQNAVGPCSPSTASNKAIADLVNSSVQYNICGTKVTQVQVLTGVLKTRLETVDGVIDGVHTVTKTMSTAITTTYNVANKALGKLTFLPKVGQIIQIALRVLQVVKTVLASVSRVMGHISRVFDTLVAGLKPVPAALGAGAQAAFSAARLSSTGAGAVKAAQGCVHKTKACQDDGLLEQQVSHLSNSIYVVGRPGAACAKNFNNIERALNAIVTALDEKLFNSIRKALDEINKFLTPIIQMIQRAIAAADKVVSELNCCYTPPPLRIGLKVVGQALNVVTCPLNGLVAGVEGALKTLENALTQVVSGALFKLLKPVANMGITYPAAVPGSVKPLACSIDLPWWTFKTVQPFKEWINALDTPMPTPEVFSHAALSFGQGLIDTCKNAVNEVGKGLGNCCTLFKTPPPCWGAGKGCAAGTSCKRCCNGKRWNKRKFRFECA